MSVRSEGFVQRLDAVMPRLAAHADRERGAGLTDPDPGQEERWEEGQVWAHTAEFLPYWLVQVRGILAGWAGEPVPFGRVKADPGRLGAIERDRHEPVAVLFERIQGQVGQVSTWLDSLPDDAWGATGGHPALGTMGVERIIEEFMVGHLEQHTDQLDGLAAQK